MKLIKTIICVLFVQVINGQQDSTSFSIDIDSIYITASTGVGRVAQRIDAVALSLNPVQNISSAINEVPGVYMHTGTLNTNRITVRGIGNRSMFSTTKLRAYIDDIPLTNGVGETTVEDFDREILHSIELYKGPGATAYGSGLGGLMLLQSNNRAGDNFIKSQIATGEYGFLKTNQVASIGNDTYRLKVLHGYQHTDGFRANNNYDNRNYSIFGGVNKGGHSLSILLHHININAQIPSSLDREDFDNEPNKAAFTWGRINGYEDYTKTIAGLTYSTSALNKVYWKSTIFGNLYEGYESRPFNILDDNSDNYGLRSSIAYDFETECNSELLFGLEYSKELYNWDIFSTEDGLQGARKQKNKEERNSTQLFAQYRVDIIDKLEIEVGVNANLTSYTLEDQFSMDTTDISGAYDYKWIYSPRINIKYSFDKDSYVYGLISHGYSIPTLEETLTPDGLINNEIRPEIGLNTEIGYRGVLASNKLRYDITAYHMSVKDLLVARRTALDQFIGINAGGSRHLGVEIDIDYRVDHSEDWSSKFDLSYSHQRFNFSDFVDGDRDYTGNNLTGVIPNQVALGWGGAYKGTSVWLKYKYIDSMPMRDDNSIDSDAYSLIDLYVSQMTSFGNFDIKAIVGINNLLDTNYASMILINASSFGGNPPRYYYPGLPINIFAQTAIKYNF